MRFRNRSLRWSHPTAFLFFLSLGGALMARGVGVYLLSPVSAKTILRWNERVTS